MKSNINLIESHVNIISSIINGCLFDSYLELGVANGNNLMKVVTSCPCLKKATGVEKKEIESTIFHSNPDSRIKMVAGTSTDIFFENNQDKFDCIFIDACHDCNNVLKDFNNSIKVLNSDGLIFMHDTYPANIEQTQSGYCDNAYMAYLQIVNRLDCEIVTLPTYAGLSIVRIIDPKRRLLTLPESMQQIV